MAWYGAFVSCPSAGATSSAGAAAATAEPAATLRANSLREIFVDSLRSLTPPPISRGLQLTAAKMVSPPAKRRRW